MADEFTTEQVYYIDKLTSRLKLIKDLKNLLTSSLLSVRLDNTIHEGAASHRVVID